MINRQIVIAELPNGKPGSEHFHRVGYNLPAALTGLLAGEIVGKRMVKIS